MKSIFTYRMKDDIESETFDSQSSSIIKLNNSTILYLREVNRYLAVVCILREDSFDKQGIQLSIQTIYNLINSFKSYNNNNLI